MGAGEMVRTRQRGWLGSVFGSGVLGSSPHPAPSPSGEGTWLAGGIRGPGGRGALIEAGEMVRTGEEAGAASPPQRGRPEGGHPGERGNNGEGERSGSRDWSG
jgi:hypothetical protein